MSSDHDFVDVPILESDWNEDDDEENKYPVAVSNKEVKALVDNVRSFIEKINSAYEKLKTLFHNIPNVKHGFQIICLYCKTKWDTISLDNIFTGI